MRCPNCYTPGLSDRLLRCPRCDWLLVDAPAAGSSAARPTPPVTNPWSKTADPALPVLPGGPSTQDQTQQLWGQPPAAGQRAGAEQQRPVLPGERPLTARQRLLLAGMASGPLLPPLVLLVLLLPRLAPLLRSAGGLAEAPLLIGVALVLAALLLLRLVRSARLLLDALSGELRQEVDQAKTTVVSSGSARGVLSVRFERLGTLRLADRHLAGAVRPGQRYRISFSPYSKLIWTLQAVQE